MKTTRTLRLCCTLFVLLVSANSSNLFAQSWNINGNANIAAGTNYLGTSDPNDLVFRTNALERARIFGSGGAWRFGNATNNAQIDSLGRLSFTGQGAYRVGGNRYAFQYSGNTNYGLFFNSTNVQYEFRNGSATPVFFVNANTGAGTFLSTLKVGAYTLPATDGVANQVLKTNGAGVLTWSNDNAGAAGWSLTGNSGSSAATNFVGTTDAVDLVFRANNIEGMRLANATRRLGLGTAFPSAKLHINAALDEDALRVQTNGTTRLFVDNAGGVSIGTPSPGPTGGLYVLGSVGVGISSPHAKLHVIGGTEASLTTGGFVIIGDTASTNIVMDDNEIQSRNNNLSNTLFINPAGGLVQTGGDLDVNGSAVNLGSAEQLSDGGANIIASNSTLTPASDNVRGLGNSTNRWTDVWAVDGTINTSDLRDKKNIRDLDYGLKEIMKLRSVKFNWKSGDNKNDKLGVIAQEIQKVLPEVVRDYEFKTDEQTGKNEKVASARLGVMYADIIPVLIKGMQEQQKEIDDLKALVAQLVASNASVEDPQSTSNKVTISSAVLEQNIPNPLNGNTSIRYSIPNSAKQAALLITDINGKSIKQIPLTKTGAGTINIEASTLNAGTYNYTLIIDGKYIDSKKMIIAR